MIPYVITPPAEEPVSVADVKAHLRIDIADEDDLLAVFIRAARAYYESVIWRALVTQTLGVQMTQWPGGDHLALKRPPLQSVTSVVYTDSTGAATTFAASNYNVYANGDVGLIWLKDGQSWPSATLQPGPSIVITYVAGQDADDVSELDKQAVRMLTGHFYENREAVVAIQGISVAELPMAIRSIIHMRRAW